MLIGLFHKGSGLGNQLFRYVMTRVLALDKGYDFGMAGTENFKGKTLFTLDMGKQISFNTYTEMPAGKLVVENDWPLFQENPKFYNDLSKIEDSTIIDGEFQGELYWRHREKEIREWLNVEPLEMKNNLCIINFRGGEYQYVDDLFLPMEYWLEAIRIMNKRNVMMQFEVVTDDISLAKEFFPYFKITHELSMDWRKIRYAKYLILSNSSFAIFPAWLNTDAELILAPKYWARRNRGYWNLPYNDYSRFTYL